MSSHCFILRNGHVKDLGSLLHPPLLWKIQTVSGFRSSSGHSVLSWRFQASSSGLNWPPQVEVGTGQKVSVSRSGGEKNYVSIYNSIHIRASPNSAQLEYIYDRPRFLATCIFAVDFIIFSNASSNAVAFAVYIMRAAGLPDDAAAIRGVAIAAITAACLIHVSWRKGGILLNNAITIIKVAILLSLIVLGFATRGGASFGHGRIQTTNFDIHTSFANPRGAAATYASSFIYIIGAYNGFRQPFYVSIPRVLLLSLRGQGADFG